MNIQDDTAIQTFIAEALSDRDRNVRAGNDTENALFGSLILVSTVFLTGLLVVLGNADNVNHISPAGKVILIVGLLATLVSMGCGIKHYFVNVKFYRDAAKIHHKDIELLKEVNEKNVERIAKEMGENEDKLIPVSNDKWLYWEIRLLAIVGATFALFITSLLFNFQIKF